MSFLDRVGREIKVGDFLVYVTAGDRHPVLEFGFVEKFHVTKNWNGDPSGTKIKFQKSTPEGQRIMIRVEDVPGHWRGDTPQILIDYDNADWNTAQTIMPYEDYWEGRREYWIPTTYKDTNRHETTMLELIETTDPNEPRFNKRMMVMEPVV